MLWIHERDKTALRLDTHYDTDTAEYVIVLHHPDGRQVSQLFSTLVAFRQWLFALEARLTADRWTQQQGSPDLVTDGWPDTPRV
jgi:hypothetical protein